MPNPIPPSLHFSPCSFVPHADSALKTHPPYSSPLSPRPAFISTSTFRVNNHFVSRYLPPRSYLSCSCLDPSNHLHLLELPYLLHLIYPPSSISPTLVSDAFSAVSVLASSLFRFVVAVVGKKILGVEGLAAAKLRPAAIDVIIRATVFQRLSRQDNSYLVLIILYTRATASIEFQASNYIVVLTNLLLAVYK